MTFGEKLRMHRLQKNLSQAELGKLAGLGLNTISNYESGKTYPRNRQVYKTLADILDVAPDYLHNENDTFVEEAKAKYGSRGKRDAQELLSDIDGLFAGGDMAEEDMEIFMKAVQDSFWKAKERNRKKYTRKDYRKSE